MEKILYSANLAVHILAAVLCVAAPFYQLRWVKLRGKLGFPIIYTFDNVMEKVLHYQVRICFFLISVLVLTGFSFPLIHYAFHGQFIKISPLATYVFAAKAVLAVIGLAINSHGVWILDPEIQSTFATFSPSVQPSDEILNRFWKIRTARKNLCRFCFGLALIIIAITPILRFYK
ncbi:MAG: hypothetical protein M0Z61_04555 [Nitrospiraceae bacterium]|nr:hypothetical protein [Nitrospiraceae bacterium]